MTAVRTPTTTSSVPSSHSRGERLLGRLGLGPREAAISILAVGLGLFWLAYLLVGYSGGSTVEGAWIPAREPWAFDLAAYVSAAQRLVADGSLYAADLIAGPFEPGPADLFYYAPPLGVAMLPFTELSLGDAAVIWWLVRIAALLLACALMPVRVVIRALAFAVVAFSLPGLKDPLLGNVSVLLLLPLVAGWRWMDRPIGSMALAAAMSVRPSLGILLAWQLLRRRWTAALWTIGAGLALILFTLPFVGIDGYFDYLAVIANLDVPVGFSENRDLGATALHLGAPDALVGVIRLGSIGIGVVAILLGLRRDREISYMVTLTASLLLVPLLWDHYLATLVIPAALLAERWHPVAIVLPLLAWLPAPLLPVVVLFVMTLPFLVPDREVRRGTELTAQPRVEAGHA